MDERISPCGNVIARLDGERIQVVLEQRATGMRLRELETAIAETVNRLERPVADDAADPDTPGPQDAYDEMRSVAERFAAGGPEAVIERYRSRFTDADRSAFDLPPPPPSAGAQAAPAESDAVDRAIGRQLEAVIGVLEQAISAGAEADAGEPRTAEAVSDNGDVVLGTSEEQAITYLRLRPDAKDRGADGLGQVVTTVLARAMSDLTMDTDRLAETYEFLDGADEVEGLGERATRFVESMSGPADQIDSIAEQIKRATGR